MDMRTGRSRILSTLLVLAVGQASAAVEPRSETSPAGRRLLAAERAIAREPGKAEHHVALALAFSRRARESADPADYQRALEAIARARALDPASLEAKKVEAWARLGQHDFEAALAIALELQRRIPDDVLVYGLIADAQAELGEYAEAERAVQWMLDLRPGNVPGLTRAAFLRETFGDLEGALELMRQAFERIDPAESEDRAWVLSQMAGLELERDRPAAAAALAAISLELFPRYHYALGALARARAAQGNHGEAVSLLAERYHAAPHPENLYDLGAALARAGSPAAAEAAFSDFALQAEAESGGTDNANRELAAYYADHACRPLEALRVARLEGARRQDVRTLDVLAWALHHNGDGAAARAAIEKALAVGTGDSGVLGHAALIAGAQRGATGTGRPPSRSR